MPPWICRYFSDDNSNHLIERIRVWKRNRDAFTHSKLFRQITTTEELKGIAEDGANLCKNYAIKQTIISGWSKDIRQNHKTILCILCIKTFSVPIVNATTTYLELSITIHPSLELAECTTRAVRPLPFKLFIYSFTFDACIIDKIHPTI